MTDRRFQRPLTDDELEQLTMLAMTGDSTVTLVAFYNIALGDEGSSYLQEDSIDPREFAIPLDQINAILDASPKDTGRVWIGLDWMNVGPSSYEPASA